MTRLEDRATPATFTVNATTDTGAGAGNEGDLRYCITQANATALGEGETEHTIEFAGDLAFDTITLQSALPGLSKNTEILGLGENVLTIARAANAPNFRIFTVTPGASVWISDLWLTNGSVGGFSTGGAILNYGTLTVARSTIANNSAGFGGGGIANYGNLEVRDSTIEDNLATNSDAVGGGIFNFEGATLDLLRCDLTGNRAVDGGGIYNQGNLQSFQTGISENIATNKGGGIYNKGEGFLGQEGGLSWNTATNGGGVFNESGATFETNDVLLWHNIATGKGGGIYNQGVTALGLGATLTVGPSTRLFDNRAGLDGGGVWLGGGPATFDGAVLTFNQATGAGGAVYVAVGAADFTNFTTISNNQAGVVPGICFLFGTVTLDASSTAANHDGAPAMDPR